MTASAAPDTPMFSRALKAYTVGLLTLIYTANYVDRQIVAILLQSIKTVIVSILFKKQQLLLN